MLNIKPLAKIHDRTAFDCGNEPLNRFLQQYANQHSKKGLSKTYVLINDERPHEILGFYSLSSYGFTGKQIKGYPDNVIIPCMLLGRLAIANQSKGLGLSDLLTYHALQLVKNIAEKVGIAFVIVEPKTKDLIQFYSRLGFVEIDDLFMAIPVKNI